MIARTCTPEAKKAGEENRQTTEKIRGRSSSGSGRLAPMRTYWESNPVRFQRGNVEICKRKGASMKGVQSGDHGRTVPFCQRKVGRPRKVA